MNIINKKEISSAFEQIYDQSIPIPVNSERSFLSKIKALLVTALESLRETFGPNKSIIRGSNTEQPVFSLASLDGSTVEVSSESMDPLTNQVTQLKKVLITEIKERVFREEDKQNLEKIKGNKAQFSDSIDKKNALLVEALHLEGVSLACINCKERLQKEAPKLSSEEMIDLWITTFIDEMFASQSQDAFEKELNRTFSAKILKKIPQEREEGVSEPSSISDRLKKLWKALFLHKDSQELDPLPQTNLKSQFVHIIQFNKKIHDALLNVDDSKIQSLRSRIEAESLEKESMEQEDNFARALQQRQKKHVNSLALIFPSKEVKSLPLNLPRSPEFTADTIKERKTLIKNYLELYRNSGVPSEQDKANYFATIRYLLCPEKEIPEILTFCAEQSYCDVLTFFLENDESLFDAREQIQKVKNILSNQPISDTESVLGLLNKRIAFFEAREAFSAALSNKEVDPEDILKKFTVMEEEFTACNGPLLSKKDLKETVLKQIGDSILGQVTLEVKQHRQNVLRLLLDPVNKGKKVLVVCSQDPDRLQLLYRLDKETFDRDLEALKGRIEESHSKNIVNKEDLYLFKNVMFYLSDTNRDFQKRTRYDDLKALDKAVLDDDIQTVNFLLHRDPECFSSKALVLIGKLLELGEKIDPKIRVLLEKQNRLINSCSVDSKFVRGQKPGLISYLTSQYPIDKATIQEALPDKGTIEDCKALTVFLLTVCRNKLEIEKEKDPDVRGHIISSLRNLIDLDNEGKSAFAQAIVRGDRENSKILWKQDKNRCYDDIRYFISLGQEKAVVEELIDRVKEQIVPDWKEAKEGPLWISILNNDLSAVQFLLDCDPSCTKEVIEKMLTISDIQENVQEILKKKLEKLSTGASLFSRIFTYWKG